MHRLDDRCSVSRLHALAHIVDQLDAPVYVQSEAARSPELDAISGGSEGQAAACAIKSGSGRTPGGYLGEIEAILLHSVGQTLCCRVEDF